MDPRIERLDPRRMDLEMLAAHASLMCEADGRLDSAMADDPGALAASIRTTPAEVGLRSYAASTPDGGLVGVADSSTTPGSRTVVSVHVRPAARRLGIGTRLVAALAADAGSGELEVAVDATAAGARGFLVALGWSLATRSVTYSLSLGRDGVVPVAPPAGYAIEASCGPWPPERVPEVADLRARLPGDRTGSMPLERRVAALRERERALDELGVTRVRALALHRPSGSVVGIHEVCWSSASPTVAHVSATVVHPDHGRRGVGAALKRRALGLIGERMPSVTELRTTNDSSGLPIQRLNRRLGFAEVGADETWVVGVADLLRHTRLVVAGEGAG